MDDLAGRFRAYLLAARRRSPLTADVYLREATMLASWLGERGLEAGSAKSADILGYLVWRQTSGGPATIEGLSRRTMARVVSSVHALYKFLRVEGLRADDPSELIETPKQSRSLPEVLALDEVDRFLASIDVGSPRDSGTGPFSSSSIPVGFAFRRLHF